MNDYIYKWKNYVNERKLLRRAVIYDTNHIKKSVVSHWLLYCKQRKQMRKLQLIYKIKFRFIKIKFAFYHWLKWSKHQKVENTLYKYGDDIYKMRVYKYYINKWCQYVQVRRYYNKLERRGWLWRRRVLLIKYINIWVEEYDKALLIKPVLMEMKNIRDNIYMKQYFFIWKWRLQMIFKLRRRYNKFINIISRIAQGRALRKWMIMTHKTKQLEKCRRMLILRCSYNKWVNYCMEMHLNELVIIGKQKIYLQRWYHFIRYNKYKRLYKYHQLNIIKHYWQFWRSTIYHHQLLYHIFQRKLMHLYIQRWRNKIINKHQIEHQIQYSYRRVQLKHYVNIWKKYCLAVQYKRDSLYLAIMFNEKNIMKKYFNFILYVLNEHKLKSRANNYLKLKYLRYWQYQIKKKQYNENKNITVNYMCHIRRLKMTYYAWLKYTNNSRHSIIQATNTLKIKQKQLMIKRAFNIWREELTLKRRYKYHKLIYYFNRWKQIWSVDYKQYRKLEVICVNEMMRIMRPLYIRKYFQYFRQAYELAKFRNKYQIKAKLRYAVHHWYDVAIYRKYCYQNVIISLNYWSSKLQRKVFEKWRSLLQDLNIARLQLYHLNVDTRELVIQSRSLRQRMKTRKEPRCYDMSIEEVC